MTIEADVNAIADMVKGRITGSFDSGLKIIGTCSIDNYVPDKISFIRNEKYAGYAADLRDAVILIPEDLADYCEKYPQNVYILVEDPAVAMMDIQDFFYGDLSDFGKEGTASSARIDETAEIGDGVYIGENVVIGRNVVIGSGTRIHPNVSVYENCRLGSDCVIDSGACIGTPGFRIEQDVPQKTVRRMLHVGSVVIGDRVEIGANTTIDRATFENDATEIADDVKIDNLVQIGHNAGIGARNVIAAQTCIGGSVKTGEDVWIGIGVTVSNGVKIGDRAKLLLNAVVAYDVPDDEVVSGFYAMPHRTWKNLWEKWRKQG